MGAEIDRLDISIEAQAKNANAQIDSLISKLTRMQSALGTINGSGLNQLASGVQRLGTAMQSMSSVKSTDFSRLTKGIEKIGTVNQGNIGNVANALNLLTQSFSGIGAISSNAMNIGEFAKNVSKLGNKSTTTAITNMPLLASSLKEMMASLSSAPKVSKNLINMTNALANLSAQGSKVGSSARSMNSGFTSFSNGAVKATKTTKSLATSIGMLYGKIYLLIRAFKALGSAITTSMDFLETSNYFEVAMNQIGEDSADQWKDYGYASAENYADSFSTRMKSLTAKMTGFDVDKDGNTTMTGDKNIGLNPEDVMNYQAMYAQMSDSLGLIGETSLNTSKALTMLGADWASLRNISLDTAWEKFASALAGQSRAVRSLGIDITQATLQETAYKYGLDQSVMSMNQATKAQLRLLTMLDQSEVAFGDIANTISSPANQLRILQQGFSNLARTIGNLFLPIVSKVLPYINAMVVALQRLFSWIGKLLGIKFTSANSATGGMSDSVSDLTDSTDDATDALDNANAAAKKLKTTTLGIDELNINDPTDSSSSGSSKTPTTGGSSLLDDAIGTALAAYEDEWNKSFDRMDDEISKFADAIENYFKKIWEAAEPTREALKRLWNEGLADFTDFSIGTLQDFYSKFLVPVGKWTLGEGLPRFFDITNAMLKEINWGKLRTSLKSFYEQLTVFTKFTFTAVLDFYEDFLKPIAVWTMNKALPFLVDTITDLSKKIDWNKLNNALDAMFAALAKFTIGIGQGIINFFELIEPFATTVLASAINVIASAFDLFFSALGMIPITLIEGIGTGLATVFITLTAYKTIPLVLTALTEGFWFLKGALDGLVLTLVAHPWIALAAVIGTAVGVIISANKRINEEIEASTIENWGNTGTESVGKLQDSFSALVDNVTSGMQSINEKISSISDTRESIADTKGNIDSIGSAIDLGAYTVDEKVADIKESFETLLNDSTRIFDEEYGVIVNGLAGSLGDTLTAMGADVPALTSLLKEIRDTAVQSVSEIQTEMGGLESAYDNGTISQDEFYKSFSDLNSKMNNILGDRSAVDSSITAMNDLKGNLNFSEWVSDGTLDTSKMQDFFTEMKGTFNTGRDDINTSMDGIKDATQDLKRLGEDFDIPDSKLKDVSLLLTGTESNRAEQIGVLQGYATQVSGTIQDDLIGGINSVVDNAVEEYKSLSPLDKLLAGSQGEYVGKALTAYQTQVIDPVTSEIETMYSELGINGSTYAGNAGKNIVDSLFDEKMVHNDVTGSRLKVTLKSDWESILNNATKDLSGYAQDAGKNTISGFNKGITDNQTLTHPIVSGWMNDVKTSIHDSSMDFGSPSKTAWTFGQDTIFGFNNGITDNAESTKTVLSDWINNSIAPFMSTEQWSVMWDGVLISFQTKWQEIVTWWDKNAMALWWNKSVMPWFAFEKWSLLANGMKLGITTKWTETANLWKTNITTWWNTSVAPWFALDKWTALGENMKKGIYGGFSGIVSQSLGIVNALIEVVEKMFNKMVSKINDMIDEAKSAASSVGLHFSASKMSEMSFGRVSLPKFATGGFPEDGLFMANHSELIGQFSNGQTAVANNAQIVSGISAGVSDANESVVQAVYGMAKEIVSAIENKDTSTYIGDREIALASRRGSKSLGATILI